MQAALEFMAQGKKRVLEEVSYPRGVYSLPVDLDQTVVSPIELPGIPKYNRSDVGDGVLSELFYTFIN